MENNSDYIFKIAENEKEFNLIHKLNYKTFVEEIPQHDKNKSGYLIDKFHVQNTYIISLYKNDLIGMVAIRDQRPFSLDFKIPNLDSYPPKDANMCELRLLSIKKEYRNGFVFYEIAKKLIDYCKKNSYDYAIISGTTRQLKLYKHIGFAPFYHLVGKKHALYQPMFINMEMFEAGIGKLLEKDFSKIKTKEV
ncbi:GNAT family N-acyltransferase [Clostridium sp. LCP25S3_F8]|uniref:GNAT family N-acyltransferase n=1 Tax=Clostridium sp. LCP25S3_F8 TaxID=3438751 RepID=UPI003F8DC5AF